GGDAVAPLPDAPLDAAERAVLPVAVGAVVGAEEDEGVAVEAEASQRGDDLADPDVQLPDHLPVGTPALGPTGAGRLGVRASDGRVARPLIRRVRRLVGDVEAEGAVAVLLDEPHGVPGDQVGGIARLIPDLGPVPPVEDAGLVDVRVIIHVAADEAPERL